MLGQYDTTYAFRPIIRVPSPHPPKERLTSQFEFEQSLETYGPGFVTCCDAGHGRCETVQLCCYGSQFLIVHGRSEPAFGPGSDRGVFLTCGFSLKLGLRV